MAKSIIDISMALDSSTPEWPGDTPFSYRLSVTKEESGSVNIGELKSSTHIGTHIDAPIHFSAGRHTVDRVLSEPLAADDWQGLTGFVHEAAREHLLDQHPDLDRLEFYLCGPPPMIEAINKMLAELGIAPERIACDAF